MISVIVILTILTVTVYSSVPLYNREEACKDKTCKYKYVLSGELHDKRGKEMTSVTAIITLQCESVGYYNNEKVTYYCMEVNNINANLFEIKKGDQQKSNSKESTSINSLMSRDFCFLRNNNGKILSVIHPPDEPADIVNLKKTIASSFQANFAKTETEVEIDSQSKHKSHYSYETHGKDTIEHRTINNNDVSRYSGKFTNSEQIGFNSKEDITINNNIITQSHGKSNTILTKTIDSEEQQPNHNNNDNDDDDIPPIETNSEYKLILLECLAVAKDNEYMTFGGETLSNMDTLLATYDERHHDLMEMEQLYNELPDLDITAHRMARNVDKKDDEHGLLKWKRLLYLESKQGPLLGKTPIINKLINKLNKILFEKSEEYRQLRLIIYSLLSYDSSLLSQEMLTNLIIENETSEMNNILIALIMLQSVELSTVTRLTQYITQQYYNNTITNTTTDGANNNNMDQLLLSYATLGRHKNVEQEVVSTLIAMITDNNINDTSLLIHLIHALGNTGSPLIIPHITPFIYNNDHIQHIAIDALRTVSTDYTVKQIFNDVITQSSLSFDMMLSIVETCNFPYHSYLYFPERPTVEDNEIEHNLIDNIVNITIHFDDPELNKLTKLYLKNIGIKHAKEKLQELSINTNKRERRSTTTNWSSTTNSIYNLIDSYSSRRNDVRYYPYHKAFLWGKSIGQSKIHAKLAVGGFGGVGATGYKVFGKGAVDLYVYGKTFEAVRVEYKNRFHIVHGSHVKKYVKIIGITLLQYSKGVNLPYEKSWSKELYNMRVFRVEYNIFIWIGFLKFYVEGRIKIDSSIIIKMDVQDMTAEFNIRPTFSVTGGASVTLLVVWQVGIEIKASIGYYISPKASTSLCDTAPVGDATACFGIYHGSKGINVDIYAYYKKRSCSRFFKCVWKYGGKLSLFSSTYRLGALRQSLLWGKCLSCTCIGPFHNYCLATANNGGINKLPRTLANNCYCKSAINNKKQQ